jgi:hypothetical protein
MRLRKVRLDESHLLDRHRLARGERADLPGVSGVVGRSHAIRAAVINNFFYVGSESMHHVRYPRESIIFGTA